MPPPPTPHPPPTNPALPINPGHVVRQFTRRLSEPAAFIYREIAQRMAERFDLIQLKPQDILDAGCGQADDYLLLAKRYPGLSYTGLDLCPLRLQQAQLKNTSGSTVLKAYGHALMQRLGWSWPAAWAHRPPQWVNADMSATQLPAEQLDLVWSNLSLHWHPTPPTVMAEWRRILRVGGLAMFSYFGPATFQQLRWAIEQSGLKTVGMPFVDMHDVGDMMSSAGFADPVMDQEILTLTYADSSQLLADVRKLGGNAHMDRYPSLMGKRQWAKFCDALSEVAKGADERLHLHLEISYGHAWRAASHRLNPGETRIPISTLRPLHSERIKDKEHGK